MLKKRIIAVLPIFNGIVVQSIGFKKYLPVGKAEIAIEFLNSWGIDEIVVVDISARKNNLTIQPVFVKMIAQKCFVPLAVGGGINNLNDVDGLIRSGADKVIVNNSVLFNTQLITEIAKNYGDQCVVASVDVIREKYTCHVFDYLNHKIYYKNLDEVVKIATEAGAGELLINAVHRDGSYLGYDIELYNKICNIVTVPVLACGGAKNADSMADLLNNTKVSAACAGNFFHFFEHSVNISKSILSKNSDQIRVDMAVNYKESDVDMYGRLNKKSDITLDNLLYLKIEKEII